MDEIDDQSTTARYLGVSERTLEDWRYRRIGPAFIKAGKYVRYRKADVDAWVGEHRVSTEAA